MLTIIEYAQLAGHVYQILDKSYANLSFTEATFSNSFKDKSWFMMTDVDPSMKPSNHFFCQLYLKFNNQIATHAVIAIRGTVFTDKMNLLNNVLSWGSDVFGEGGKSHPPLSYLLSLINFTIKVQRYIRNFFPHISHLRFTGHSLGGALAQLIPLKTGYAGEVVAFNSPGVGNFSGLILGNQHWVHNINARYGFINKLGKPLGSIIEIDVPDSEAEAKQVFEEMDETDYLKSKRYYQLSDSLISNKVIKMPWQDFSSTLDTIALHYRVKSYAKNFNRFKPALQNNCDTATFVTLCIQVSKISALGHIIAAQHSIDNLVRALQRSDHAALAYSSI